MNPEKKFKIVLAGGGSGGHIFPLLAVAREMKRILPERIELYYIGPKDEWVNLYLAGDVKVKKILAGKIRRYVTLSSIFLNFIDVFKSLLGFIQSIFVIFFLNPDVIFSKGGFGSIPVVLAGKLLATPIFAHESDSCPGLANRLVAKTALTIFTSFPNTEYLDRRKVIEVGNPIRRSIFNGSAEESRKMFNLTGEKPVLFVFAGSQGSQRINDIVLLVLPELLQIFEIIHQCGAKNYKQVKAEAGVVLPKKLEKYYHLLPFLNEEQTREAYFAADIVVARAGSGTIFEAAALEKALFLIPLPESAQNHQYKNAYNLERVGAAVVLEEKNLTPQFFVEKLEFLINHEETLENLRKSISKFARPDAAKRIAHYILEYLLV